MISSYQDFRFFFHLYSHKIFFWFFILFFALQVFFWNKTENIKPALELVPPAPSKYLISAASLGDKEFLFRAMATRLQNSGDVFAGFVALKKYDYSRIYQWLTALDGLNNQSNFAPSLAAYIYSQTQTNQDTRYIIDYLDEHSAKDIDKNWWWLFQAIYIAKNNLGDMNRALELAYKLSENNAKNAPLWTKQMPAFIHEEMGDGCMAFSVIQKILNESESGVRQVNPDELNFMRHFIQDRLHKLKEGKFDPKKCHNNL
jgi:hypothetical protein